MQVEKLIQKLITERNYDPIQTQKLAPKIEALCPEIRESLVQWVNGGNVSSPEYSGYSVDKILKAKPGMTTRDLNDICKKILAEGCMELGLIEKEEDIGKYYMHGVSHHLGIDVHDVTVEGAKLAPGSVITDEPGLYIDEWEIGIRIEDDLLITEDGCKVLSADIIRNPDAIEAFMAK